jgi:hypothetical protein
MLPKLQPIEAGGYCVQLCPPISDVSFSIPVTDGRMPENEPSLVHGYHHVLSVVVMEITQLDDDIVDCNICRPKCTGIPSYGFAQVPHFNAANQGCERR